MLSDILEILNCVVILSQNTAHYLKNVMTEHQLEKLKRTPKVVASIWLWELDSQLAFGEFVEVSSLIGREGMLISNLPMTQRIGFM